MLFRIEQHICITILTLILIRGVIRLVTALTVPINIISISLIAVVSVTSIVVLTVAMIIVGIAT